MFLFKDWHGKQGSSESQEFDVHGASSQCAEQAVANKSQCREFFAFKAARFIGGAARQVGTSIARFAAGHTAKTLHVEVETRASGSLEELNVAVADWAKLLNAQDDTPRYTTQDVGTLLTFRAAFLQSRAFELALARAHDYEKCTSSKLDTLGDNKLSGTPWEAFLRCVTLRGGHESAAKLSELLPATVEFPGCQKFADVVVAALKADAELERFRSQRSCAGMLAEELRASASEMSKGSVRSVSTRESQCRSSADALKQYAKFRAGLKDSIAHLQVSVPQRRESLRSAIESMQCLGRQVTEYHNSGTQSRAEILRLRSVTLEVPRNAVAALESDSGRYNTDARMHELEKQKRELQMKLDEVSKSLARRREERLSLLSRRDEAVTQHRRRTEAVELQLTRLRPSQLHQVIGGKVDCMTEGEIVGGLSCTTSKVQQLTSKVREGNRQLASANSTAVQDQHSAIEQEACSAMLEHGRLQVARLQGAAAATHSAVTPLLDSVRTHATRVALGLQHADLSESRPGCSPVDRQLVCNLRAAVKAGEAAWDDAVSLWDTVNVQLDGPFRVAPVVQNAPNVIEELERARARIADDVGNLQRADPVLFDLALQSAEAEAQQLDGAQLSSEFHCAQTLPHGWEMYNSPDGTPYYYSIVSKTTQWEQPEHDAAICAGWQLVQADNGMWFYHNPHDKHSVWWPQVPEYAASPAGQLCS